MYFAHPVLFRILKYTSALIGTSLGGIPEVVEEVAWVIVLVAVGVELTVVEVMVRLVEVLTSVVDVVKVMTVEVVDRRTEVAVVPLK